MRADDADLCSLLQQVRERDNRGIVCAHRIVAIRFTARGPEESASGFDCFRKPKHSRGGWRSVGRGLFEKTKQRSLSVIIIRECARN